MPSITPSLWFDHNLEEAATFYTSVFPNSRIEDLNRSSDAGPGEPGSVLSGTFVLDGTRFIGINGGPHFAFSEAVSFTISCKDQDEDRFGLSWQVIPERLYDLLSQPDPARATAATQAMLGMRKIVLADLESAAASV
jgi:predicted 3-demethylubiquinone-9 3-methyltransferase (glyoxalase superfamily)